MVIDSGLSVENAQKWPNRINFENILTNYKAFTIRDRKTKQSGNEIKWEKEEA